jgi:LmbE family N-acetylglucosaminyl deacetylase
VRRHTLVSRGEAGIATTDPEATAAMRSEEQVRAAAAVGVWDVDFLDHPDGTIEYGLPLRRDLARSIRRCRPDVLVTVNFYERRRSGDWNTSDHRNVGVALLDAATDAGNPWVFPELVDEGFPPWAGVRCVAVAGSPASGHAVDVTDGMDAGIEALAAHAGYLASLPPDNPMGDTFSPAGTLTIVVVSHSYWMKSVTGSDTMRARRQSMPRLVASCTRSIQSVCRSYSIGMPFCQSTKTGPCGV